MAAITVYTTPSCSQCDATMRMLDKDGIDYDVVDLATEPEILAEFKSRGLSRAPIVQTGIDDVPGVAEWSGLRPDLIRKVTKAVKAQDTQVATATAA